MIKSINMFGEVIACSVHRADKVLELRAVTCKISDEQWAFMSLSKASMSDRGLEPRLFAHAYVKKQDAAQGCL